MDAMASQISGVLNVYMIKYISKLFLAQDISCWKYKYLTVNLILKELKTGELQR